MRILWIACLIALPNPVWAFEELDTRSRAVKVIKPEVPAQTDKPAAEPEPEYFPDEPKEADSSSKASSGPTAPSSSSTSTRMARKRTPTKYYGRIELGSESEFTTRLGYKHAIGRYLYGEFSGFFSAYGEDEFSRSTYGPELGIGARFPNRTIFTPWTVAGPGYETWKQKYEGRTYDKGSSSTLRYELGVTAAMTNNFGMIVARRVKNYNGKTPRLRDGVTPSKKRRRTYEIGFQMMF